LRLSYGSGGPGFSRARSGDEPTTPVTSTPIRCRGLDVDDADDPVPTTAAPFPVILRRI
jgi:hypothetical protein